MAQKLRDDKIGALSQGGGIITLAASTASPSWLTIGGQQYKITSNLTLTVPTLTANTLYMIYAVQTAGVVSLVQSTNVNSVGPAGFLSWKLVGAYYSNNLTSVGFGGFITIEGVPTGEYYTMNSTIGTANWIYGAVVNPTYGTVASNLLRGRRVGKDFVWEWEYKQTAAGTAGSGTYFIPTPFPIDYTFLKTNTATTYLGSLGTMWVNEESSGAYRGVNNIFAPGGILNTMAVGLGQIANGNLTMNQDWSASYSHFNVATIGFAMRARFPVTGWSNTPLKDL